MYQDIKFYDKFISDVERAVGSGTISNRELASLYVDRFVNYNIYIDFKIAPERGKLFDLSISSKDADITNITKKASLISDQLILTHASDFPAQKVDIPPQPPYSNETRELSVRAPGLDILGEYISEVFPLLKRSGLIYAPNFIQTGMRREIDESDSSAAGISQVFEYSKDAKLIDYLLVEGRRVIEGGGVKNEASIRLIKPLLILDLPYVEGTSLTDFCKIYTEESDSLISLQDCLRWRLLDLDSCSPDSTISLARLESDIRGGIRGVEAELKRLARRSAVEQAGAGLATVTAVLLAFGPHEWAQVLPILGASAEFGVA
jgi:hypothetical protein